MSIDNISRSNRLQLTKTSRDPWALCTHVTSSAEDVATRTKSKKMTSTPSNPKAEIIGMPDMPAASIPSIVVAEVT